MATLRCMTRKSSRNLSSVRHCKVALPLTSTSTGPSIGGMTAFDDWRARSPYYDETHEALAQSVRRFVEREIAPHIDRWEAEGELPRALHKKAA
jgi:acyl-CoA dehydrogenase